MILEKCPPMKLKNGMNKLNKELKGSFTWVNQEPNNEYFSAKYPIHIPWWRKLLNVFGFKKDYTAIIK